MKRLGGLDLARGLACLGMIEAHAYDAYVDAPDRVTAAFALTRFIALLPLPLFLTLAGMGVALRVQRGLARGEAPHDVRRELVWRGFRVVLAGFALNVIYGLMDGARELGSYLRFDVLHVIGASSMLLGLVLPGRVRPQRTALVVALLVLLPSPWLNGAAADLESPLRFALVPFVDVPPFTVMPLFPLAVWCALGAAITPVCVRWPGRVALVALGVAVVSSWASNEELAAFKAAFGTRLAPVSKRDHEPQPGEVVQDGLLIRADKNPNAAGVRAVLGECGTEVPKDADLVLVWGEGFDFRAVPAGAKIVFLNAFLAPENGHADVFLPVSIQTERSGHYTNFAGVTSRFERCFAPPPGVLHAEDLFGSLVGHGRGA